MLHYVEESPDAVRGTAKADMRPPTGLLLAPAPAPWPAVGP